MSSSDLRSKSFHLAINQQAQGPFTYDEVVKKISEKGVDLQSLAWYEGLSEWQSLEKIGFLSSSEALEIPPISAEASVAFSSLPSTGQLISSAFGITKKHWGKILLIFILSVIAHLFCQLPIQLIQFFVPDFASSIVKAFESLSLMTLAAGLLMIMIVWFGITFLGTLIGVVSQRLILGTMKSEEGLQEKVISSLKESLVPLLCYSFVFPFMILLGFLFLIIPGIYLSVAYCFAPLWIFDQKLSFWEGMEASRKAVHRHWFRIFWYLILMTFVALSGALLFLVGLLFTIPMVMVMMLICYEALLNESKSLSSQNVS